MLRPVFRHLLGYTCQVGTAEGTSPYPLHNDTELNTNGNAARILDQPGPRSLLRSSDTSAKRLLRLLAPPTTFQNNGRCHASRPLVDLCHLSSPRQQADGTDAEEGQGGFGNVHARHWNIHTESVRYNTFTARLRGLS